MTDDDFADLTPAQMVALIRLQQAVIARQEHELRLLREAERIPLTHAAGISCDWPEPDDSAVSLWGHAEALAGAVTLVAIGALVAMGWAVLS